MGGSHGRGHHSLFSSFQGSYLIGVCFYCEGLSYLRVRRGPPSREGAAAVQDVAIVGPVEARRGERGRQDLAVRRQRERGVAVPLAVPAGLSARLPREGVGPAAAVSGPPEGPAQGPRRAVRVCGRR